MINNHKKHLILSQSKITEALQMLNDLGVDAILFVIDVQGKLIGSLTDGDVRRGLLKGLSTENVVDDFIQSNPKYIRRGNYKMEDIIAYRQDNYKVLPVIDQNNVIVNLINFRFFKSYLPVDAVVMAGGRGERLRPYTDSVPKPMLKVGDKPIIEHNIDRLSMYGIDDFWISVKYLGEQIEDHFGDGSDRNLNIKYVWEDTPLGTIGAVSKIDDFEHEYVLITNSDLLTNLDYEDFFIDFLNKEADFSIVTIPYQVKMPYAILETDYDKVLSFKEKPTYTYFANAGIYLMKKDICKKIPYNESYNATDLLQSLIMTKHKVVSYQLREYWLDVGKHDDYKKAQEDIKHIKF